MSESSIIPSTLYKAKVFESRDVRAKKDGGTARVEHLSTECLEDQMNAWVEKTGCVIVTFGPVQLHVFELAVPASGDEESLTTEIRTVALTYAPPLQVGDTIYGAKGERPAEQDKTETQPGRASTTGAGPAESGSDLRLPASDIEANFECPSGS